MRKFPLLLIFTLLSLAVWSQKKRIVTPKTHEGLRFTENKGQWESTVNYMVRMSSGNIYLEKDKLTYFLFDYEKFKTFHMGGIGKFGGDATIKGHAYQMEFVGCNKNISNTATDPLSYYENYYIGNDKSKWASFVKNYKRVVYPNVYPNIDFEFLTNERQLKYNFIVKPGSDHKSIQLKYNGARSLKLKDGALIIETSIGSVIEEKPFAYQVATTGTIQIPCVFKISGDVVSFEIAGPYDRSKTLIIDPTLVFAAQSGSTADNFGMTATYDPAGNFYTGGTVFNLGYPTTTGAYSNVFAGPTGGTDVVITKFNANGTAQIFSTYLGGNGSEVVSSLIVNSNNELYLYGSTGSSNFPTPAGAYDNSFNGGNNLSFVFNGTAFANGTDIYVCKFNSSGSALLASTYIGGSDNDGVNHVNTLVSYTGLATDACPNLVVQTFPLTEYKPDSLQFNYGDQFRGEIQLDKLGNIYVASSSRSANFPVASNAFDNSLGGKQDAVVFKFDPSLSNLIWSSYLGGAGNDAGYSLIVTDSMYTYVTGGTFSTDFPTLAGCYNTSYNGGKADGYIVKINTNGSGILKGTYIGTSSYDQSYFVQRDKNNNIYVYGQSQGNMPVIGPVYNNPNSHQFISRLDCQLSNINRSTVIGAGQASIDISPSAFSVDNCGNIYISGWGGNITNTVLLNGMPTTTNALYPNVPNGYDFYLMALSSNMSMLVYATYFGGSCSGEHVDGGTSRFDPTGKVYQSVCAGCGGKDDFPVSPGAWPNAITPFPPGPNLSSNCNNGVFKIDFNLNVAVSSIATNTIQGCVPLLVNFTNVYTSTNSAATFTWYFGNGATNTTVANPAYTYTTPGTYTVSLVINDPGTCNVKDSSITYITVLPVPNTAFTASFAPCGSTVQTTNGTTGTLTSNPFTWNWGDASPTSTLVSPSHTYAASGIYTITLSTLAANGCSASATRTVSIFYFSPSVTPGLICEGGSTNLTASGGTSYSWSPSTGLSNPSIANPAANPTTTTIYTVTIQNNGASPPCVADVTTTVIVNPKPLASFNYSINPCGGGVYFYDASTASITAWNWNINPFPVVTSTVQDPYYFYPNGGTYTISLISTNQFGCTDTTAQVINVPVPPPLAINSASTICKGSGGAQLFASGGISYTWSPGATLSATNIANPIANPTISTGYSVVLTTSNNCTFLLLTNVFVNYLSSTTIAASATPTRIVQGATTQLVYTGDPGAGVSWNPGTFVTPKTGYTVTAAPDRPTTYTVIAFNGPCRETLYVFVDVVLAGCEEGDAFVPNTFTPNGDGQNDILYLRGIKVEEIYFAVYNRWGEMVFETKDKAKGWDGIYKGRPADVGVFGWYLKVKCYDGNETFKKGNVTLIR
jgi:gliding motility-associated-like protein